MGVRPNRLREALRSGRPTFGTNTYNVWPGVVEMIGYSGTFDYVQFTAEYNPFDLAALDNFCRAAELHGLSTMIKLDQEPRKFLAQRSIGSGFESVQFADVTSVSDARECIAAVRARHADWRRHPRLFGPSLCVLGEVRVGRIRSSTWPDIVIVLMIEKRSAIEHIDEILAVPGIRHGPIRTHRLLDEQREGWTVQPSRRQGG